MQSFSGSQGQKKYVQLRSNLLIFILLHLCFEFFILNISLFYNFFFVNNINLRIQLSSIPMRLINIFYKVYLSAIRIIHPFNYFSNWIINTFFIVTLYCEFIRVIFSIIFIYSNRMNPSINFVFFSIGPDKFRLSDCLLQIIGTFNWLSFALLLHYRGVGSHVFSESSLTHVLLILMLTVKNLKASNQRNIVFPMTINFRIHPKEFLLTVSMSVCLLVFHFTSVLNSAKFLVRELQSMTQLRCLFRFFQDKSGRI